MIFDLPLKIVMLIFFGFLGPLYAWGMTRVFRINGNSVFKIKTDPFTIYVNPRPWGFLWSNAAVMGILSVVSFTLMVWLIRGGDVSPYQAYFDLFCAFISALPAMWWTDSKLRQFEQEERDAQRECLRAALYDNLQLSQENRELRKENLKLKKTNVMLAAELQITKETLTLTTEKLDSVTNLLRAYEFQFRHNQIIENNLPPTGLRN